MRKLLIASSAINYVQQTLVDNEGAEKRQSLFKRYTDALGSNDTPYTPK